MYKEITLFSQQGWYYWVLHYCKPVMNNDPQVTGGSWWQITIKWQATRCHPSTLPKSSSLTFANLKFWGALFVTNLGNLTQPFVCYPFIIRHWPGLGQYMSILSYDWCGWWFEIIILLGIKSVSQWSLKTPNIGLCRTEALQWCWGHLIYCSDQAYTG